MKSNVLIRYCLMLCLTVFYACKRNESPLPNPSEPQEESVFLVQLGNQFAAFDWNVPGYKWMSAGGHRTQFFKMSGSTIYQIDAVPQVAVQSWADSSALTNVSQPEFITKIDPATGQRLSGIPNKLKPDFLIQQEMSETGHHESRLSQVTIADDKVIVLRGDQRRSEPVSFTIHALNLKTGDILWTYYLPDEGILNTSVQDEKLYIGCPERSFALDIDTGKKVKDYPLGGGRAVGDKYLFFWTYGKKLVAADRESGQVKWEFDTHGGTRQVQEILLADQTALISVDGTLHAVDANSGAQKWNFKDLKPKGAANRIRILTDKQTVYAIDQQLRIHALEVNSGNTKWQSVSFHSSEFDGDNMSMIAGKRWLYVQQRRDQLIQIDLATGDYSNGRTYWAADMSPIRDFMILY